MAGFPVLTTIQPIVGVDFHKSVPPPPPVGPLMTPHVVVWGSGFSQKMSFLGSVTSTSKASTIESGCAKPTAVGLGHACGRTHDAGPHVAHIWPNVLLPMILLGSGSKAEFGSGSVKVAVSAAANHSADMAINVAYVMNTNLDCQDFPLPPAPTGLCFTVNYNVTAGFTPTDFLRGLSQMGADSILTWLVGLGCAAMTVVLRGVIGGLMGRGALAAFGAAFKDAYAIKKATGVMADGTGYFASNGRLFVQGRRFMWTAAKYMFKNDPVGTTLGIAGTLTGIYGIGTPLGYAPQNPVIDGRFSTFTSNVSTAIDGLYR